MNFITKLLWGVLLTGVLCSCDYKPREAVITIYCTTDIHGSIFDYDLKKDQETNQSLSNVSQYLKTHTNKEQKDYLLLDGGDFLQGQPSNYYSNFIDTASINIMCKMMNYLEYDAAAVGNHDIEAGHKVYDKVKNELNFPWLSANTLSIRNGQPYFKPYSVFFRNGIKIAVLGMTTPGIPKWLPHHLWSGLEFADMIGTARQWIDKIREKEKPDLIIGLFHSGFDYNYAGENENTPRNENAGMLVARQVDGFDVIILGHDHQEMAEEITNDAGHKVLVIDPKSHASRLGKVTVSLKKKNGIYEKEYISELVNLQETARDTEYNLRFAPDLSEIKEYIDTKIGHFAESLSGRDGLFGPSAFTDLIHNAQLETTGADISFSTVLEMDARVNQGDITIRDMFNLYKYENGLYTMRFSGQEIDKYLEYACYLQYNTMHSATDHLLKFTTDSSGNIVRSKQGYAKLANDYFNFSCAAGIKYTVDVSKEPGKRVTIHSMSDGRPFCPDSTYNVAINSYRGNGGGGHLTSGLGLSKGEMTNKIVKIEDRDVRYYITEYIKKRQNLTPQCRNDWKIIPEKWFTSGKEQDYRLLYP